MFALLSLVLLVCAAACQDKQLSLADLKPLDLSQHGFPFTIKAPKGAVVMEDTAKRTIRFVEKSIVVKGEHFQVRIEKILPEYANPGKNPEIIKANQLNLEKTLTHRGTFRSVVQDDKDGFVYSTNFGKLGTIHHFYYVAVLNEAQYEFSNYFSVSEEMSKEDIELMYAAVRQN